MLPPVKTTNAEDPGQRERLLGAVGETIAERGFAGLTVERIVEIAGVSRTTFYENFADKHEAVEAAVDVAVERYLGFLLDACAAQDEWPLKVKVAIGATLDFAAAEPAQAALVNLDEGAAPGRVGRRAADAKDRLASLLATGRRYSEQNVALPALTEQALVAGMAATVSDRLRDGEAKRLPELAPELVQIVLSPYLGQDEARRVAMRPRPGAPKR